jgi:hypothetical protein
VLFIQIQKCDPLLPLLDGLNVLKDAMDSMKFKFTGKAEAADLEAA